ncbi:MAG: HAMP domain-containing sensor histidine kinase [Deltaproteobacteria bacterium]
MSIKRFIFLWMGFQVFCFLVLILALLLSNDRLQAMASQILSDAHSIEMAHRLENTLLNERREDLLWRDTGQKDHYSLKIGYLQKLDALINQMKKDGKVGSENEDDHLRAIIYQFVRYKKITTTTPPVALPEISHNAGILLHEVEAYREQNRAQMKATLLHNDQLDTMLDRWSIGLICFVFLVTTIGAILLKDRIIKPTSALSRSVVRFGKGERDITTPVFRNDELGMLSKAVNDMIANITRLQQERRYFFANLAHDLKNPLMLIGATARRLKNKQAVTDAYTNQIDRIIEQTESVEQLISELMDAVRIEDGNLTLEMAEVDLDQLARSVCDKESAMISSHSLIYQGAEGCRIMGDRRRLERVLTNLLSNAIKYSEQGSTVTVTLTRKGLQALLSVQDNGAGIPPEQIGSLFKPFSRLSHTSKMAKGTGLGLFAVKKIIDGHGGTISVDSAPGRGTTVTVVLDLVEKEDPKLAAIRGR